MNISQQIGEEVSSEANEFYKSVGYTGGVKNADFVFVARENSEIVGLVRLCNEQGVLVLRGLYVSKNLRGNKIGTKLLGALNAFVGKRECWCVPFRHLIDFYSTAGFCDRTESEVPSFLLERSRDYGLKGMDVVIMKRSGR